MCTVGRPACCTWKVCGIAELHAWLHSAESGLHGVQWLFSYVHPDGLTWLGAQMDRYEEYPKMRELIQRKDDLVAQRATPPYFLKVPQPDQAPASTAAVLGDQWFSFVRQAILASKGLRTSWVATPCSHPPCTMHYCVLTSIGELHRSGCPCSPAASLGGARSAPGGRGSIRRTCVCGKEGGGANPKLWKTVRQTLYFWSSANPLPPLSLRAQADLRELKLNIVTFGTKFDVVLVDPPWEEYARRAPGIDVATWAWQDIMRLEIEAVVDTPSFIFLWCVPPLSTPVTPYLKVAKHLGGREGQPADALDALSLLAWGVCNLLCLSLPFALAISGIASSIYHMQPAVLFSDGVRQLLNEAS